MIRESFIIYTRFYKPIQKLTDEQLGRLFRALFQYNSTDESICVDEDIEMAFGFFSNQMDIDNTKWQEKVEKLRANAKKSRSKQLQPNATKSNQIGLVNENVNVNVNENVNNPLTPLKGETLPQKRFIKPTRQEVAAYAASLHYANFNADAFCDFYDSKGWKVGSEGMKDWKAAVRNWQRNNKNFQPSADYLSRTKIPDREVFKYAPSTI